MVLMLCIVARALQADVEAEMEQMHKDPKAHKGLPTVFDFYTEVRRLTCCPAVGFKHAVCPAASSPPAVVRLVQTALQCWRTRSRNCDSAQPAWSASGLLHISVAGT